MKKIFGLLAVCALVACNDSSENVAGPQQWGQQGGQQQGQDTRTPEQIADSILQAQQQQQQQQGYSSDMFAQQSSATVPMSSTPFTLASSSSFATVPTSSAPLPASSAAVPKSSAATPKSSAVVDDGKIHMTEAWDGSAPHVPVGNEDGGWWYKYDDNGQDGASSLTWEAEPGTGGDMGPVIEACGTGICGSFELNQADYAYDPFVGFAFGFGKNDKYAGDASAMRGVCIEYKSTAPISVELGLTSATEKSIGYANPAYDLSKSTSLTVEDISWSSFDQPSWAEEIISGTSAAKELSSLKFKITGTDGLTGTFAVTKVGPLGTCD